MTFKPLKPGDRIALLAPSSPFEVRTEGFERGCNILESNGYKLSFGRNAFRKNGYLAGTEAERAEDLISAINDPEIAAILCIRGGYGSGRLLDWLPFSSLERNPKVLLGHSDITFLHLAFQSKMGWTTFHGPNLIGMGEVPERCDSVLRMLRGDSDFQWKFSEADVIRHGVAEGPVLGGNLTCLVHLIGTPYFPDLKGALLLVEDCNEAVYRIDRLFTQLKMAGILGQLGGILLGQFTDCGEPRRICDMVLEQVKDYQFPIVSNLPFGHGPENEVIPFGVPFSLNTHDQSLKTKRNPFSG